MHRRTVLVGVTGVCASLAGCSADDGDSGEGQTTAETTETTTATPTPSDPVLADRSLSPKSAENCPPDGEATIQVAPNTVSIDGCLWGPTGCSVVRLATADYDADSDTAQVVVETVEDAAPDEGCSQALVPLGYQVDLQFDYQLPRRAIVVHDDANGERTVAQREL